MTPRTQRRFCKLDAESEKQMENDITRIGLSARAYDRIHARHVAEAIQYHTLDRTCWQQ